MSVEWNRFWCRVLFKEFIKHFRKLNDEQIVKDVRQSMDDLEDLVPDTDSFGSQMVRWSLERADEPFAVAARENGKKGGRPPKNPDISATATLQGTDDTRTGGHMLPSSSRSPVRNTAQRRIRPPRSFEEVAVFADAQGLDYDDARLWWQRNFVERPGCDKDGVAFDNWKGALVNACRAEEAKRNG